MHGISFNFPSSFDHFGGGLGDIPLQEGTKILNTLLFLEVIDVSHVVKPPSHSAPAYTVGEGAGDLITVMSCIIR